MSKQDPRPAGMSWAAPYLAVSDVDTSIQFYQRAFGFEKISSVPGDDGVSLHAELKYKDQVIMIGKEAAYDGKTRTPNNSGTLSPISMYLYCENVDNFCDHAKQANAIVEAPPEDMFWGDRMCRLVDPDGYQWSFATHKG